MKPVCAVQPHHESSLYAEGLRFEEIRYASDLWMPTHIHEQHAFLDFCVQGTIQEHWETPTFTRGPSTLAFFPIGAPHATRFSENVRTFQIVIEASWLERVQQIAPLPQQCRDYQNGIPPWIVARMYRELQRRDNLTPLILEGMTLELMAEIVRQPQQAAESRRPRWLQQAQEFLHAHFTESPSMEKIATEVGVHPSHLMRGFRQHLHCTVGDYIRRLRVEYACHLLSTSDSSPAQIGQEVGFADQSHFHRTFKSGTGMTPAEFQKVSGHASLRQD